MKKQKKKRSPWFWVALGLPVALVLIMGVMVFANLPKPQAVSDESYDLAALQDGVYTGECDNGLVFVKVEVEVHDHIIANVRILEHRNGMGAAAETLAQTVVNAQSVEVDTVSGATMSSQSILKAIENALA